MNSACGNDSMVGQKDGIIKSKSLHQRIRSEVQGDGHAWWVRGGRLLQSGLS